MKVTYIYHSSFAVELEKSTLIFDYYGKGDLPERPAGKQVYFLNSHSHPDHFSKKIFDLREQFGGAEYVLAREIRLKQEEKQEWIHSLKPEAEVQIGELRIRTLKSTDLGVAFVVETEGKRIYHAGDLNWWHWEGEDKAWNNNMAANYKREINELDGCEMDAAFVPLDGRLEGAYYWGMKYFLEHVSVKAVFPMHCWEKYEICRNVQDEPSMQGLLEHFYPIEYEGQEWTLC